MASNYSSIRAENERRYGTDIGRIGKMLLANLCADRTHFIFELLQNAEDAMARRGRCKEAARFTLASRSLRLVRALSTHSTLHQVFPKFAHQVRLALQ